jgi:hypothetical protein
MKTVIALSITLALTGCGKFEQMVGSSVHGYTTRCIEGTLYILMDSDHGVAITPAVSTDGKPKGCTQ